MRSLLKRQLEVLSKQITVNDSIVWLNGFTILVLLTLSVYAWVWDKGRVVDALFSDPFSTKRPYVSFLTSISEVLWCVSVTVCAFSLALLKTILPGRKIDGFLLGSTLLIALFLLDDLFRFALILEKYWVISKVLIYLIYGVAVLVYGWVFRDEIRRTPYVLLIVAGVLFAISGLVDVAPFKGQGARAMLEDGSKLLGVLNIALYFWRICRQKVLRSILASN